MGDQRVTVLIADDEPDIRLLVKINFRHAGFDVLEAGTGDEAVKVVVDAEPDVLVLDLRLPSGRGWDVLRTIREMGSRIPVVICTAEGLRETRRRAIDEGCLYLPKPFTIDDLDAAIREALGEKPARASANR